MEMGTIMHRNNMDLMETEVIKNRCKEYTKELTKQKILTNQITTMVCSLT